MTEKFVVEPARGCTLGSKTQFCPDALGAVLLATVLMSTASLSSAVAAPVDGNWSITYPCPDGASECDGRNATFQLVLWSSASQLCGIHIGWTYSGNKVDEDEGYDPPSIIGTVSGDKAKVHFTSSWGATGHATISLKGQELHWHIVDRDDGVLYMPDDAILLKQRASNVPPPSTCP
jgi:hypothetical protein